MPNTSSSVPFLLSSSMQSIRSRRPSAVLGGSQGSGLLQQLGSGMVRLTSSHQPINGRTFSSSTVRKCPSLNITFSWMYVRMTPVITLTLLLNHTSHLSLSCISFTWRGLLKHVSGSGTKSGYETHLGNGRPLSLLLSRLNFKDCSIPVGPSSRLVQRLRKVSDKTCASKLTVSNVNVYKVDLVPRSS